MTRIRRFKIGDLPAILKIERASFGKGAWPAAFFKNYARECPELFLVAQVDRTVAAYSITCVGKTAAELASIAVLARYRGRGLAKLLLNRSIRKLSGVTAIGLMVRRDNAAAIALYRSFDFVRTATVSGYYEDGATAWRMRLLLK